ncbi:helix-turn-helix transcriptional regulator [Carboxylicivirga sediminis]|uniref:Helix-turn-helix transcriptional regulator n=1 Tax=Carboxylicivirga sediminis TaxID=2006564 RepID=A0A941F2Y2_9BACT|nr:helix-turn-helix transcriptional regulator [Carboxylicivirga sediminis]MBR8534395.1 helix-turn-helix transcriptional regulator [Carboxylicivirga sediminis]
MNTFGDRLKHLIKVSELKTNKVFCQKVGMTEQGLSRIITGKNNPSFDVIQACMNLFSDTEIIWLLSGKDFNNRLALENKQLKEQVAVLERQQQDVKQNLDRLVKDSGSGINPQRILHVLERNFSTQKHLKFA